MSFMRRRADFLPFRTEEGMSSTTKSTTKKIVGGLAVAGGVFLGIKILAGVASLTWWFLTSVVVPVGVIAGALSGIYWVYQKVTGQEER